VADDLDRNVNSIGALADPVRRRLYRYVCSQPHPVSREQAAEAVGVARHQAKFHLDRLAAEGLLETDYVRLTGRTGPGAGRPAKRYRRGSGELAVTVPARAYELAGRILADAVTDTSTNGTPIADAVTRAAAAEGRALADTAVDPPTSPDPVGRVADLLADHGYEPRRTGQSLILVNCPFHALARRHTQLICQLNHALIAELARSIAPGQIDARLEPGEHRCCVTLAPS
jgi:predicted ArsR family transcriptional regulator